VKLRVRPVGTRPDIMSKRRIPKINANKQMRDKKNNNKKKYCGSLFLGARKVLIYFVVT